MFREQKHLPRRATVTCQGRCVTPLQSWGPLQNNHETQVRQSGWPGWGGVGSGWNQVCPLGEEKRPFTADPAVSQPDQEKRVDLNLFL